MTSSGKSVKRLLSQSDSSEEVTPKKKTKRRGRKRKIPSELSSTDDSKFNTSSAVSLASGDRGDGTGELKIQNVMTVNTSLGSVSTENISTISSSPAVQKVAEISYFEQALTYLCQYCPRRTQNLQRIERHLKSEHSARTVSGEDNLGYKILTRDQVVDMLTLHRTSSSTSSLSNFEMSGSFQNDYICFYCDDVMGTIYEMKNHFETEHDPSNDKFKVKKLQAGKKLVTGYLECQICGYLSPGLDRSKQKVHFHEEHPLEEVVNCSKYVLKQKPASLTSLVNQEQQAIKFNATKYLGMTIRCPKGIELGSEKILEISETACNFEATTFPAMNAHLRKHTQTFKCGHCGKTHPNSSEFHRHSAMSHGNKIPDLVKDMAAEAEFEALKGLVEANCEIEYQRKKEAKVFSDSKKNEVGSSRPIIATKSTSGAK